MTITGVRTNVGTFPEVRRALEDIVRLSKASTAGVPDDLPDLPTGYAFVTYDGAYVKYGGAYVTYFVGVDIGHSDLVDDEPDRHINGSAYAMPALDIDWDQGGVFTKTLASGANVLTCSNQIQGHCVQVTLTPVAGSAITLPTGTVRLSGELDDSVTNYLFLMCIDSATPVFLATINKEAV